MGKLYLLPTWSSCTVQVNYYWLVHSLILIISLDIYHSTKWLHTPYKEVLHRIRFWLIKCKQNAVWDFWEGFLQGAERWTLCPFPCEPCTILFFRIYMAWAFAVTLNNQMTFRMEMPDWTNQKFKQDWAFLNKESSYQIYTRYTPLLLH